jgi:hypothetical protein
MFGALARYARRARRPIFATGLRISDALGFTSVKGQRPASVALRCHVSFCNQAASPAHDRTTPLGEQIDRRFARQGASDAEAFEGGGGLQDAGFVPGVADELEADGHAIAIAADGGAERG